MASQWSLVFPLAPGSVGQPLAHLAAGEPTQLETAESRSAHRSTRRVKSRSASVCLGHDGRRRPRFYRQVRPSPIQWWVGSPRSFRRAVAPNSGHSFIHIAPAVTRIVGNCVQSRNVARNRSFHGRHRRKHRRVHRVRRCGHRLSLPLHHVRGVSDCSSHLWLKFGQFRCESLQYRIDAQLCDWGSGFAQLCVLTHQLCLSQHLI